MIASLLLLPAPLFAADDSPPPKVPTTIPPVEVLPDVVVASPLRQTVTSASPIGPVSVLETTQPVGTISGPELRYRSESSIGATLAKEPGITSSGFAPGAARPVIRGQGGERVRVLENGVGTLDVAAVSDDHAVPVDPTTIDRIEVVRGPATLRYGSNAIGGVVSTHDGRIPEEEIDRIITGRIGGAYGTADTERSGFAVVGGQSGRWNWRATGFVRASDDIHIPTLAKSRRQLDREGNPSGVGEPRDTLPNSYAKASGGGIGASYIGPRGFAGASVSVYSTDYGTPVEETVHIELDRFRVDVRGRWSSPWSGIEQVSWALAYAGYEHTEFEGPNVGTVFEQQAGEGRAEFVHCPWGCFEGAFGVQLSYAHLKVTGEEALLPGAKTGTAALFLDEQSHFAPCWTIEFGARGEYATIDSVASQTFLAPSVSAGLRWQSTDTTTWALSAAYASRAPTAIELYANGPHVATGAFEFGDPTLGLERSLGVDLSYRTDGPRVSASATVFHQRYLNYLTLLPTGAIDVPSGLEIFDYVAHEASLYGIEAKAALHVWRCSEEGVDVELLGDYVHAEDLDLGSPLPRIAPLRLGTGVVYHAPEWSARIDVQHAFAQGRTAAFELETDGYTRLDAGISRTFDAGYLRSVTASLTATNLLDEEIRLHSSFVKDFVPERGRSVRFSLEFGF